MASRATPARPYVTLEDTRRATPPAGVELELAGRDADAAVPGMRAHLEGCPACHEDHDSLAALVGSERQPRSA